MVPFDVSTLLSVTGNAIHPIAIRQYQPYLRRSGVISFAGGWPAAEMFPLEIVAEISQQVLQEEGASALQYGSTQGYEPLLEAIGERMNSNFGIPVTSDNLCVTAGAQQGIFLAAMTLISPGEVVAVESPTFSGALSVFKGFQAEILSIPMDEDGLQTAFLAEQLRAGVKIKMIYVIPDFQNPTGRTMSAARRRELVELAQTYNFVILEDSPYSELRYEGTAVPPIYTFDDSGRVIYLGSFSKVFAPLRLGWVVGAPALVKKMITAKQGVDLCCPSLTQAILNRFIRGGHLQNQVEALCRYYHEKRNVMLAGLDRHMPTGVDWTTPEGGMFIWVTLPNNFNTDDLFYQAIEEKVAFIPGSAFYPVEEPCRDMRLNFVTATAAQIEQGMATLGRVTAAAIR